MLKFDEKSVGKSVSVLYPVHGAMNVLRTVAGKILAVGKGPNGPFVTVEESPEKIRSLSAKKIVQL